MSKLKILDKSEEAQFATRLRDRTLKMDGSEYDSICAFLRWSVDFKLELDDHSKKRKIERRASQYDQHVTAVRRRLSLKVDRIARDRNISEDERIRLQGELAEVTEVGDASRWVDRLETEPERQAAKQAHEALLANLRPAMTSDVVLVAHVDSEPSDYELESLERRARKTKSKAAQELYAAGLIATRRRDKKRCFQSACYTDKQVEKIRGGKGRWQKGGKNES